MSEPRTGKRSKLERVRESSTATTLELFFDLVFVFALTQVTALMAEDTGDHGQPGGGALLRGGLIMAVIWWCWVCYSWLSNQVKADEGLARTAMLGAMAAMFAIAIAIPESFDDIPGGLDGPVVFAFCYLLVRVVHLVLFWIVADGDAGLRAQLVRFAPTMVAGTVLLLVAAQTSGTAQLLLWLAAVVADYGGTLVIGARGWRLNSASHFVERHGLIVIIALGESIVAIGVGVNHLPISWPIIGGAVLGLTTAACLWWAYFDTHVMVAERALAAVSGHERARMARAAFTYLHLPIVVGVVMLALGLKKALGYLGGADGHSPADHLHGAPLWALFGGTALYLLAQAAVSWRCNRMFKPHRLVAAALLVGVTPLMGLVPVLVALVVLTAVLVALIAFEWVHYRAVRAEVRHAPHAGHGHAHQG
ncbi:low temperature requirement protein A [Actinokineospora spheciospongiae]|uniref:low temperature requirement protein A n=1 Tax=Actinokineospora spheciospongiae TaxID=909613 RepID=UPI000D70E5D1|nr:low temperature requirement protein A [Actinokineospora spheciospongiae]PWW57062.1 low temperature requirement protein LtrA [Actinokineospora spheciospongiae]